MVTKRDNCVAESLESCQYLKRKYCTQIIETSANIDCNIQDAFRILASKTLMKKVSGLSSTVPPYEEPGTTPPEKQKSKLRQTLSPRHILANIRNCARSPDRGRKREKSELLVGEAECVIANGALDQESDEDPPDNYRDVRKSSSNKELQASDDLGKIPNVGHDTMMSSSTRTRKVTAQVHHLGSSLCKSSVSKTVRKWILAINS